MQINVFDQLPLSWVMKLVVTKGGTNPFESVQNTPERFLFSSSITCIWNDKAKDQRRCF